MFLPANKSMELVSEYNFNNPNFIAEFLRPANADAEAQNP
jgi:hypothetical protein